MSTQIELENRYCARNYDPLPVVLTRGEGVYVWDDNGNRYLDMMSAYSAVSHGHCHPRLVNVVKHQAARLNIVSRAYYSDKLGPFLRRACELTGQELALPMNTGAEAVETAIKAARKWAYDAKGVASDKAEIIAFSGNFHGRTTTVVAMSDEPQYKRGFGPFPPGFVLARYGDIDDLRKRINGNTAALIIEPIQGEGGIIMPPTGYLRACKALCEEHRVLFIADEIQTGLGRTGKLLACQHEDVVPDGLILGKALGGGILPVSMFLASKDVLGLFRPGDHGSTFGGNPLAAAVGLEALDILVDEDLSGRSAALGEYLIGELRAIGSPLVKDVRGLGLFVGLELDPARADARRVVEGLLARGVLSKETHKTVVRLAPPLVITREQIDWAISQIAAALADENRTRLAS